MALTKAQQEHLRTLSGELAQTKHGSKRPLVEAAATALGLSVQSVYRALASIGQTAPRKKRADAGSRSVDRDLALQVAGLVHTARRANGKKTMTMATAVEILAANGCGAVNTETGEVSMPSVSTLSRTMREYGCHPDQLRRAGTRGTTGVIRSLHPNWSWQTDASVCVLYYLPGGKMALLDERQYNERKPGKLVDIGNQRITRYPVVDHCTGVFYVHYAMERGESATGALSSLIHAMTDRGPRDPMHGVPFHLYTDPGSAYRSSLLAEFCSRLDIKLQHHEAGRANATGSVEVVQNIIETQFESRLRFSSVDDLASLQSMADQWRRHYNAHALHSRLRMPRASAWLKIKADQLRVASHEALIAISHWKLVERTVSDRLTISVDTRLPGLPPQEYDLRNLAYAGLRPRDKVRVELNPFSAPDIIVIKTMPDGEERRWNVSPVQKDEWGFDASAPVMGQSYRAMPETETGKALKEIKAAAKPTETAKHAFPDINILADVREAPLYLRPAGTDILPHAELLTAAPLPLTHAQAAMRLRELATGAFELNARACMDYVRARFPNLVPEDKINEVAADLTRRFGVIKPATVTEFTGEYARIAAHGGAS